MPVRSACWVLVALLFYAVFIRELLSKIALDKEGVGSFFAPHATLLAHGSHFGDADLEFFLGFVIPHFGYPFLFGGVVLYLVHSFAFHRKHRQARGRPDCAGP